MLVKASKVILLVIITELCLGGGGRLTALGPVSLRMILFAVALVLAGLMLIKGESILTQYWKILVAFLFAILLGLVIGLINHSPRAAIWEDIKPLLYFFILPFFALTTDKPEIISSSRIIKLSSLMIAAIFFATLIAIHSKGIPFLMFYKLTEKTQEFFYRGELSFFYKGFLFLGIGAIFYFFSDSKKKYFLIGLLVVAIIFSVTRGLLFALAVTLIVYYIGNKNYVKVAAIGMIGLALVTWGNEGTIGLSRWIDSVKREKSVSESNPDLFGVRNYSDEGRVVQIKEVLERVSFSSFFFGHGFGQAIPSRPIHMEIAYLEVFHKQGLAGLAFWGLLAWMIFRSYVNSDRSPLANAFFYGSIFIFAQSLTNQYFNNPIGMSVLLLSLVSLDKLRNPV